MTNDWYDSLGYDNNPFQIDPILDREKRELVGHYEQAEEILYRVSSGAIIFIEGASGSGKSQMLRHIIDNFRGKGRIVYVTAKKINKRVNISDLLKNRKNMILLVDDVDFLTKKNSERIKYYYDQDIARSVVFTGNSFEKADLSASLKQRIGKRVIKLEALTSNEAVTIVQNRLNNDSIIEEKIIRRIFVRSNRNMKTFLSNCDRICSYMHDESSDTVQEEYIDKVIGKDISVAIEEDQTIKCKECESELIKMGEYWRCPNCEEYCEACGVTASEDDLYCKGCGAEFDE